MYILIWLVLRRKIYLMEKLRFEDINLSEEVQEVLRIWVLRKCPHPSQAIPVI